EIVLKAYANGEIRYPVQVFGDLAILQKASEMLNLPVKMRASENLADLREGYLNVHDMKQMDPKDLTPGQLSAAAGAAARAYVVAAAEAALAGEIAAMVTLPMNKEATQLTDPNFVGHTELIGAV